MSSPIHHANDLDPTLRYAPPRVRQQGRPTPDDSSSPPLDRPWRRDDGDDLDLSGDREIVEMRRRLALEPQWVPEPPPSSVDGRDLWKITLRTGVVLVFAALIAWVVVSIPGARQFGTEVVRASFLYASTVTNQGGPLQSPEKLAGPSRAGPSEATSWYCREDSARAHESKRSSRTGTFHCTRSRHDKRAGAGASASTRAGDDNA